MYSVHFDDERCLKSSRIGIVSRSHLKDALDFDQWEGVERGDDVITLEAKGHKTYLKRVKPTFREREVLVIKDNKEEKRTLALVDGKYWENGSKVKLDGDVVFAGGKIGTLLPAIQVALKDKSLKPSELRSLIRAQPAYAFVEGAGALKPVTAKLDASDKKWNFKPGNTTKTGRVLRRFLPKSLSDADIQSMARLIDEKNPVIGKMKDFEAAQVLPYSAASSTPGKLGSCMWRTRGWETLELECLGPPPKTLPDPSIPWEDGVGPFALIFTPSAREVHEGHGNIRAFVWPVEVVETGQRTWFIDRVYPANPYAREFMHEFAKMHGFLCKASYEDFRQELPFIRHTFARPRNKNVKMPYWDTFRNESSTTIVAGKGKPKGGFSDSHFEGYRCVCGEKKNVDTFRAVIGRGTMFPFCNKCVDKLPWVDITIGCREFKAINEEQFQELYARREK